MGARSDTLAGGNGGSEPIEVTLLLSSGSGAPAEALVRRWGAPCGLAGAVLDRLVFAVGEVLEAAHVLATSLGVVGSVLVRVRPFSRWLTVELTLPQAIPLDPTFDQADAVLEEMPGMRVLPDIFWRRVILQWVDKATWQRRAGSVTVALSQYARRTGGVGELYFLGLTPRPMPGLELRRLSDELTLAISVSGKGAFKLDRQAAFVLAAVDGSTPVRDIYRAFVREHGLVHPTAVGAIVEDLIARGLVVPGEPLAAEGRPPGVLGRVAAAIAHFKVSLRGRRGSSGASATPWGSSPARGRGPSRWLSWPSPSPGPADQPRPHPAQGPCRERARRRSCWWWCLASTSSSSCTSWRTASPWCAWGARCGRSG